MKDTSVVRRYAESLFAVSRKQGIAEAVRADLRLVSEVYRHGELPRVLAAPSVLVTAEQKKKVLSELFASRISRISLNFLFLLVDKGRTGILESAADEFETIVYESMNIGVVNVESVYELSEEELARLKTVLEKHLSKKLIINKTSVNPAIIGGMRITVGDDVLDGSVAAGLADIKRSLLSL